MTTPVHKPASYYLLVLKVAFGLALIVMFMTGTTWVVLRDGRPWLLVIIGVNALIMIVVGILRAIEQTRARSARPPETPGSRRMAGIGRGLTR